MTRHLRIAAWLHVISGVCVMLALSTALVLVASSMADGGFQESLKGKLGTVGIVVGTALCLVAGMQLIGGVAALAGLRVARPLLLLSSALQVINVPLGTALAVYTFWIYFRLAQEAPRAPLQAGPA